jgi:glycosyltransferase involved in cell wall biosynthesis
MLTLSVVTPSYQQGAFIRRTIESVLNQAVPVEYIVMDGGSTDETVAILKEYFPRIAWVSERDRGQAHAVNKAIRASHGEIIGWLNSDDIYYPGAFQKVLAYFESHPDVDVVYGEAYHIDREDQIIDRYPTEPWDFAHLLEVCFICQPGVFFRRSLIERYGYLDENLQYAMDYELWVRWGLKNVRFALLDEILAGSRLYAENKTLRNKEKPHREFCQFLRRSLGSVPERWIYNYGYAVVDSTGRPRTQKFRHSFLTAWVTLYASLRWNRKIPWSMWITLTRWVFGNLKASVKERFAA